MRVGVIKSMALIYRDRLICSKLCYFATINCYHTPEGTYLRKNEHRITDTS